MKLPLKIQNLKKNYGDLWAVNDVSFEIQPGEVVGLLGPNGAGKTSLISTIVTVEAPTSGTVEVFGHDVQKNARAAKVMTGCVPQEAVHHPYFTIEELLYFQAGYYGVASDHDHIHYLLDRLALLPQRHKKLKQLSGGMKRRFLIAKALVHKPKLLLLDEPTAGVDVELRTSLWDFVQTLRDSGVSVLLTTHYLEEAEALCDRVLVINKGKIKLTGEPQEIIKKLTEREVVMTLKEPLPHLTHPYLVEQSGHKMVFRFSASRSIGELISELPLEMHGIQDLIIREGKLEHALQHVLEDGE